MTPLSFTFTDGVNTITSAPFVRFEVATDGGGTTKSIETANYLNSSGPNVYDLAEDAQCGPGSTVNGCSFAGAPYYRREASNRNAPGSWRLQTTPSVPEPSSMLLVGAALAGFAARRRVTRAR